MNEQTMSHFRHFFKNILVEGQIITSMSEKGSLSDDEYLAKIQELADRLHQKIEELR